MSECYSIESNSVEETFYQKNRDVILHRGKDYKNDKERLREQAKDKYRSLSDEEKNEKQKYGRNRYHNMSEEKKQRLKEYQKHYREAKKIKIKHFDFFFHSVKMEQEGVHFGENSIIKSAFHKNKKSININEADINRIALSDKILIK